MKLFILLAALCQSPHVYVIDATTASDPNATPCSSGVVIKEDAGEYWILTCAHYKDRTHEYSVMFDSDPVKRSGGKVLAISPDRDLALIQITFLGEKCRPLLIRPDSDPIPGKDTKAEAFGYGNHIPRFQTNFKKLDTRIVDATHAKSSLVWAVGQHRPGDSGGALVIDGQIAGIDKCYSDGKVGFVTHKEIHKFLKEAKIKPPR